MADAHMTPTEASIAPPTCTCGGMDYLSCVCGLTIAEFTAATGRPYLPATKLRGPRNRGGK